MLYGVQAYFKNYPLDWKLGWPGEKKGEECSYFYWRGNIRYTKIWNINNARLN